MNVFGTHYNKVRAVSLSHSQENHKRFSSSTQFCIFYTGGDFTCPMCHDSIDLFSLQKFRAEYIYVEWFWTLIFNYWRPYLSWQLWFGSILIVQYLFKLIRVNGWQKFGLFNNLAILDQFKSVVTFMLRDYKINLNCCLHDIIRIQICSGIFNNWMQRREYKYQVSGASSKLILTCGEFNS